MKGDFSRDTFRPRKHYNAVLMQQGRVQLDADWNEQRAIDRHRIETEARDVIGSNGGRMDDAGFEIKVHNENTLSIGPGNLYVDGILCQNEEPLLFENQVDLPGTREPAIHFAQGEGDVGLVYLDVWERHVTALDDDHIREVALGSSDTTTRSRTVWQVKVLKLEVDTSSIAENQSLLNHHVEAVSELERLEVNPAANKARIDELLTTLAQTDRQILWLLGVDCQSSFNKAIAENPPNNGRLLAQAVLPAKIESPCALPPGAGYEGPENQLYRVEIHSGGTHSGSEGETPQPSFKFSRDNGSVATAVVSIAPFTSDADGLFTVVVQDLGHDETLGFASDQFVELIDDTREFRGDAGPLVKIVSVNRASSAITVKSTPGNPLPTINPQAARDFHYKLRRWDSPGAVQIPVEEVKFVDLEDGVQVAFTSGLYNTGDYWLIPARTATGKIEWPYQEVTENGQVRRRPLPQLPARIDHHYTPLALVMAAKMNGEDQLLVLSDCRRLFPPLTRLTGLFYLGGDGQEAGSGQLLPRPLVVGVAKGDRPVLGAQVCFEVKTKNLGGELEADGNTGKRVVATTNAQGEAQCRWRLATDLASQQVRASLLDGTHLPIYFNANLSTAGEAVAKSIQLMNVLVGESGQDLRVDANVPVDKLVEGIRVVCDDESKIDPQSVQNGTTCFITLEMPVPQREDSHELWGTDHTDPDGTDPIIGFRPLTLDAKVEVVENAQNEIHWTIVNGKEGPQASWLRGKLFTFKVPKVNGTRRILARLTLKGNFIWDRLRPDAYLDGEVFGAKKPGDADIELRFPSGDGRRGGDFEMWFWLVPEAIQLDSVTFADNEVTGGR